MSMSKRDEYLLRAIDHIRDNTERSIAEYAEHVISVPESRRWDYAIPENYTNYHDGFLFQDGEPYRCEPLINYNGEILYLFRSLEWYERNDNEAEKYLLFDRHGHKYTFIVTKDEHDNGGNPSYFEFIQRVKKYMPQRVVSLDTANRTVYNGVDYT